ncbi:probable rRNA-processing protein EBP2 isoform X2 [Parasteatoda tepidariorum]|nr:probable rRNA-processing protein EBP2 [Parasteatoda tepidariorum]
MEDSSDEYIEDAVVADVIQQQLQEIPKRQIIPVNNVKGLKQKLVDIQLNFDWSEKLDISINNVSNDEDKSKETSGSSADDDFQREMSFYNQALAAVSKAFKRLKKLGVPTKRPDDYFAEMAKSDAHMLKVREKLLSKKTAVERTEKVRAMREQKKLGKKMQTEIVQQRKQEKKKMISALKKTKKGKMSADNLLNENKNNAVKRINKSKKQREYRDSKYGYGGKKKGSKYNTSESTDMNFKSQGKKNAPFKKNAKFGKQRMTKHRRRR